MPQPLIKEADFAREAILELLGGNLVEKIISPPDIVNPLTASVQRREEAYFGFEAH